MKQEKEYSAKEISIFEGVFALLNQGRQLHELKVADIAAAANMGKGTAYEYFSSKEDILRQALGYHVVKEFEMYKEYTSGQDGFIRLIEKTLDYIIDMLQTRFSSLIMMVHNLNHSGLKQLVCADGDMLNVIKTRVNEQIQTVFNAGKKDKLIGDDVTFDDCRLVVNGLMSSFSNEVRLIRSKAYCHNEQPAANPGQEAQADGSLTALKARTLKLLLKALR